MGEDDNTIVVFTTDNGTELFTWPDGGTTPFAQCKGTIMEGGFRVPCIARWPGHIPADTVQNGLMSGWMWPGQPRAEEHKSVLQAHLHIASPLLLESNTRHLHFLKADSA